MATLYKPATKESPKFWFVVYRLSSGLVRLVPFGEREDAMLYWDHRRNDGDVLPSSHGVTRQPLGFKEAKSFASRAYPEAHLPVYLDALYGISIIGKQPHKNPPLATHIARGECKPVKKVRKNPSRSPKSIGRRTGVDSGRPLWWAYSKVRNRFDIGNTWLLVGCETEAEAKKVAPQLQAHIHAADRYGSTIGTTTKAVTLHELRVAALKGVRPNDRALTLFNAHLLANYSKHERALLGL